MVDCPGTIQHAAYLCNATPRLSIPHLLFSSPPLFPLTPFLSFSQHDSKSSSLAEGGIDWLPPLPEPEGSHLRAALLAVQRPRLTCLEAVRHVRHPALPGGTSSEASLSLLEEWGPQHDDRVR